MFMKEKIIAHHCHWKLSVLDFVVQLLQRKQRAKGQEEVMLEVQRSTLQVCVPISEDRRSQAE